MYSLREVKYKHILDIEELNIEKSKVTCIIGESGRKSKDLH